MVATPQFPRKTVTFEIPDPDAPGFREEMARQAANLRAAAIAADEAEVMALIEENWIEMEEELLRLENGTHPLDPG